MLRLRCARLRAILLLVICWSLPSLLLLPCKADAKREHLVYFPDTAYELNIYKIRGKKPGNTLLLIGGIQGNEPGGFLSADLYADMSLEKGNLIVVPRANFYSIITNQRGPHGDMNRKFTHEEISSSMEDKIVTILKKLISESTYLLNLHDGAGYYHPTFIDKWRNPTHFGQSVIADAHEYTVPGQNRVIKLREMAQKVIDEVNPYLQNELYRFHFMNTMTGASDSPHKDQRKSATYYALTRHHIPAFGVETSKFLPSIDLKVQCHNMVINSFMKLFDIIPESPGLNLDPPVLKYLVVSINGRTPTVVKGNESLEIQAGDSINISHIEANYERGLSLDILGYGELNDYRRDFRIVKDTTLIVRKDNAQFAEIPIRISKKKTGEEGSVHAPGKVDYFIIETRDNKVLIANEEAVGIVRGEKMRILDVIPSLQSGLKVNFKGFVGDWHNNTGEDRGYLIDTAGDLMDRHSIDRKGEAYEVVASEGEQVLGRITVKLIQPKMEYLVLKINDHQRLHLRPEDKVALSVKDRICLEEIQTNLGGKIDVHMDINGHRMRVGETRVLKDLCPTGGAFNQQVKVEKGSLLLGKIFLAAS